MPPPYPYGKPVQVVRYTQTGEDPYGNPIYDWQPVATYSGCAVAPRTTEEPTEVGRQQVITGIGVYMPHDADVTAHDRLVVDGVTYEVAGRPGRWANPYTGRRVGLEVAATHYQG